MNIVDRIKQIIEYKGISTRRFCVEVGISNGFFDKVKDIGTEKVLKIIKKYPDISLIWLITGNGKMILDDIDENTLHEKKDISEDNLYKLLLNKDEQMKKLLEQNSELIKQINKLTDKL